jgi:hypothetical protein
MTPLQRKFDGLLTPEQGTLIDRIRMTIHPDFVASMAGG